jgi:hypothetical protein
MSSCDEPERRQFDFWVGEWDVHDPEGNLAGRNRITSLFDGCALREEWEGVSGFRGTSLNSWSPQSGRWHQTWMDSSGLVLQLDGGQQDGVMILEGEAPLPGQGERPFRHRISWSLLQGEPGRLRQHWEVIGADGSWQTVFDGRYRPAAD